MLNILQLILQELIDFPENAEYIVTENNNMYSIQVFLMESDVGKVIGKDGKIIKAIRTLLQSIAIRKGILCRVTISQKENII